MVEGSRETARETRTEIDPAEFRELAEQVERAGHAIESLVNRTNTLVHLLDILSKRVDRLESEK